MMAEHIVVRIGGPRSKTVIIARESPGSRGKSYSEVARCHSEDVAGVLRDRLNQTEKKND